MRGTGIVHLLSSKETHRGLSVKDAVVLSAYIC